MREAVSTTGRRTNFTEREMGHQGEETGMYIAMNRFRVRKDAEAEFEDIWLNRDVHLKGQKGFIEFHLLRGPEFEDHTLYASHTIWASEEDFLDWTRSKSFRDAHKGADKRKPLYIGGPNFEGFTVLQVVN